MESLKYLLKLLKGHRIRYVVTTILVVIVGLLALVNPYLLKTISDDIIINRNLKILFPVLGLMVLTTTIRSLVRYYYRTTYEDISQKIQFKLKNEGFKKILHLDQEYFNSHRTGDIMTLMTADIDLVRHFYAFIAYNIIDGITIFLGAILLMLATVDVAFSSYLLIIVPLVGVYGIWFANSIMPLFRRIRQMRAKLNSVVQENISANKVVKAFVREDFENKKLENANSDFRRAQHNQNKQWRKFLPYISNTQNLFYLYSIIVGGIFVINGRFTIGELIMFNSLITQITPPLNSVGWIVSDFSNCMASLEKIKEFIDTKAKIESPENPEIKDVIKGEIEFMNVSFDYENEHALNNVSFNIYKGQKIGIIGTTGSGKSTIINLLTRFYDVDGGKIYIDYTDIKKIDLDLLRNSVAIAHQDVFLFSESVANNISYGKVNATREEIILASKAAGAHEFIKNMPEAYDTLVGERGVGLSGGQKQRIALARALLKNPSILVLDDTTSALDAQTEKFIQQELLRRLGDRTVLIISQRISSVKDCDLILVLDKGKIIERGTHDQLLKNNLYYKDVFSHQYGKVGEANG